MSLAVVGINGTSRIGEAWLRAYARFSDPRTDYVDISH